nr:immunoglobulin heavy chain junction region [Mus musculus]NSM05753.1 immunoglobulin heavy chain junction region [Mus musculus]
CARNSNHHWYFDVW